MDYEFRKLNRGIPPTAEFCQITDSLALARTLFPGKRNNLDALCDRYMIDNSKRQLHGALLDAEILSDVYLAMTGGQTSLAFSLEMESSNENSIQEIQRVERPVSGLKVIYANATELIEHESRLDLVDKKSGKSCLWRLEKDENQIVH